VKLTHDPNADAVYVRLSETHAVDSETVAPGIVLDYHDEVRVVGIEVLNVSRRVGRLDAQHMLAETLDAGARESKTLREMPEPYGDLDTKS